LDDLGSEPRTNSIAWSYCLCSGRMSKSSFANMDSKLLIQLGRVKSPFCVSEAQQALSTSFWEIMEVAHRFSVVDSGRILVTKSLFPCLYSHSPVQTGALFSSESSAYSRRSPD